MTTKHLMDIQSKQWGWSALVIAAMAGLLFVAWPQERIAGHGDALVTNKYNLLGTSSSGTVLTSDYGNTTSSAITVTGQPNVAFLGQYRPRTNNTQLFLLLERSIDGGATWVPYNVIQPLATSTAIYPEGASSTVGTPFVFPGSGSIAANVTSTFSFDMTLAADLIRVRAKESTTSTFGILSLRAITVTQ